MPQPTEQKGLTFHAQSQVGVDQAQLLAWELRVPASALFWQAALLSIGLWVAISS
jgi:hypothetical protein